MKLIMTDRKNPLNVKIVDSGDRKTATTGEIPTFKEFVAVDSQKSAQTLTKIKTK